MKAYLAENFSDEEGELATEGKSVIIHGNKSDIKSIAEFLTKVSQHLENNDYCHMHLQDSMAGWNKTEHIDIEITVE